MGPAAIFDFDGVLFDSIAFHEETWRQVALEEHRPFTRRQFERGIGAKNPVFVKEILQWTSDPAEIARIIDRKEMMYQEQVAKGGVQLISGTMDLVMRLSQAKVPCAIGTSSERKNLDDIFKRHPQVPGFFQVVVTAEDVKRGKPDPEVFLMAAQRLDVPPEYCVVFEDAPLGIQAAKSGGMKAVALTTTFSVEALKAAHPDRILDSLADLSVDEFYQLFS
jgi:HAD superfamily hydrolase (TIGR01509 family)